MLKPLVSNKNVFMYQKVQFRLGHLGKQRIRKVGYIRMSTISRPLAATAG